MTTAPPPLCATSTACSGFGGSTAQAAARDRRTGPRRGASRPTPDRAASPPSPCVPLRASGRPPRPTPSRRASCPAPGRMSSCRCRCRSWSPSYRMAPTVLSRSRSLRATRPGLPPSLADDKAWSAPSVVQTGPALRLPTLAGSCPARARGVNRSARPLARRPPARARLRGRPARRRCPRPELGRRDQRPAARDPSAAISSVGSSSGDPVGAGPTDDLAGPGERRQLLGDARPGPSCAASPAPCAAPRPRAGPPAPPPRRTRADGGRSSLSAMPAATSSMSKPSGRLAGQLARGRPSAGAGRRAPRADDPDRRTRSPRPSRRSPRPGTGPANGESAPDPTGTRRAAGP